MDTTAFLTSLDPEAVALAEQLPQGKVRLEEALRAAALFIKSFQPDSPRLDAEVLVGEIWGKEPTFLFAHPEAEIPEDIWQRCRAAIARRCQGWPVAYLIGQREFYGHKLAVTPATLIPRPETEFLVEEALQELQRQAGQEPLEVLDLCTGSGNVAISIALAAPHCRVWAQDISAQAREVAQRNIESHGLGERVTLLGGDLYSDLPSGQRFAVITANPPYISTDGSLPAEENVVRYEPNLALFAGPDGLDVIRPLISQASQHLLPGGSLILEMGCDQAERVSELMREANLQDVQISNDLQDLPRIARARLL